MSSQPSSQVEVSVCFTGDIMLSRGVRARIIKEGDECFSNSICPILRDYKYRFVNLECPITKLNHPPDKPFCFRADSSEVRVLTVGGITHATLANNHIDDQTKAGAADTYRILAENSITAIGLRLREDTLCKPAEIAIGTKKIAVFGALGIPMNVSNVWFASDSLFLRSVHTYKMQNPNSFVVCYIHWGIEYRHVPSSDQVRLAEQLVDLGADMIVGHHPHVVESIHYYKGRLIFYSLGNFIFDQADPETKKGIVVGLTFGDASYVTKVIPYDIKDFRPVQLNQEEKNKFRDELVKLCDDVVLTDDPRGWILTERTVSPPDTDRKYASVRMPPPHVGSN